MQKDPTTFWGWDVQKLHAAVATKYWKTDRLIALLSCLSFDFRAIAFCFWLYFIFWFLLSIDFTSSLPFHLFFNHGSRGCAWVNIISSLAPASCRKTPSELVITFVIIMIILVSRRCKTSYVIRRCGYQLWGTILYIYLFCSVVFAYLLNMFHSPTSFPRSTLRTLKKKMHLSRLNHGIYSSSIW